MTTMSMFPSVEAEVTLSRLEHWEARLKQEVDLLHEHVKAAVDIASTWGTDDVPDTVPALQNLLKVKSDRLAEVRSAQSAISRDLKAASTYIGHAATQEPQTTIYTPSPAMPVCLPVLLTRHREDEPAAAAAPHPGAAAAGPIQGGVDARPPWRPFTNEKSLAANALETTALLSPRRLVF